MTSRAEFTWQLSCLLQLNILRLMRRVAVQAVRLDHRFFMRLVTIQTNANFRVLAVTLFTALGAMSARHFSESLRNLLVTADTDRGQWLTHLQIKGQRLMRRVAFLTITYSKMRPAAGRMASKTVLWNGLPFLRVNTVTISAGGGRMRLVAG